MWIVKQMDFILVLFFIFMILIISGLIKPFTDFNQLLSYTCFHSIGISFVISEAQPRRVANIKLSILILISVIIIYKCTYLWMSEEEQVVLFILFFLNSWFLILGTKLVLQKIGNQGNKVSIFRYLVLSLNILFMYLYKASPSYLFITKWWIFNGVFYIPFINQSGINFWISTLFICISLVGITMLVNSNRKGASI